MCICTHKDDIFAENPSIRLISSIITKPWEHEEITCVHNFYLLQKKSYRLSTNYIDNLNKSLVSARLVLGTTDFWFWRAFFREFLRHSYTYCCCCCCWRHITIGNINSQSISSEWQDNLIEIMPQQTEWSHTLCIGASAVCVCVCVCMVCTSVTDKLLAHHILVESCL